MTAAEDRIAQAVRYLEEQQLDGLVAFNNGHNSFLEAHAVFVLSGVRPLGESAVVIDRSGDSTLIVTPPWDAERAAALSRTVNTIGAAELAPALAQALRAHGLVPQRLVTVSLATLGAHLARQIEEVLGSESRAADDFVRDLARRRSAEELAAGEKATWIAERGYERFLAFARPGLREFELAAELYCFMKELGAEDNFLLLSASQHNLAVRAAGRRVLDVGDVILSEITPCYRGQFAQICRTTVLGAPPPALREKYALLQQAMRRGQAAAVPGVTVREVTARIDDCFREAGYGDYCRPPYMRVRGHGWASPPTVPAT